jgi:hypothetical protein
MAEPAQVLESPRSADSPRSRRQPGGQEFLTVQPALHVEELIWQIQLHFRRLLMDRYTPQAREFMSTTYYRTQ